MTNLSDLTDDDPSYDPDADAVLFVAAMLVLLMGFVVWWTW